ncbi:MAG: hypothetical protein NZM18_10605 [Thermoflexales bacterium]|nr:hypothetical protein [Thermoflexales bacterium]
MSDRLVLFICTGNYYRSRYAELYFNATVPTQLGWRAISRGFAPSPFNPGPIAVSVIRRAQARGLPLPDDLPEPRRLIERDLYAAQRIIALDEDEHRTYVEQDFPAWRDRIRYWRVPDLHLMPADEAFARIEQYVDALVRELAAGAPMS